MGRYKAILFDLDETLLDFERAQKLALKAAFRELGLRHGLAAHEAYREINGTIWREYERGEISKTALKVERFRRLLEALGENPKKAPRLDAAYLRRLSRRGDAIPGCRLALAAASRRHRLGVVTNGIHNVQHARLRAAKIRHRFEVVVTSESCGFAKPDPRIVRVALRRLAIHASDTLLVGDDPRTDGAAAQGAGVAFAWLDRGRHEPPRERPLVRVTSLGALTAFIADA